MENFQNDIHERLCVQATLRITFYKGDILGSLADLHWIHMREAMGFPVKYDVRWDTWRNMPYRFSPD